MADAEPQDAYIYFDHMIEGETNDAKLKEKKAFEITTMTLNGENATNVGSSRGGASGAGKVKFEKLQFSKYSDKSTVQLIQAMILGEHFSDVVVVIRKNGVPFIQMDFKMCIVSSVEFSQSGEDEAEDAIVLDWGAVHISYLSQDKGGKFSETATADWSRVTNEASTEVG